MEKSFYVEFASGNAITIVAISEKNAIERIDTEYSGYGSWVEITRI